MGEILNFFNNREIATFVWGIGLLIYTRPIKPIIGFLKTILPILFFTKIGIFCILFISYLGFVLCLLKQAGFWDLSLLKETIYWVLFMEIPNFGKAIKKATSWHFFYNLIRQNIALVVVFEFFVGFWTFSLLIELILVPLIFSVTALNVLASENKQHQIVKRFINWLLMLLGLIFLGYAIYRIIYTQNQFFTFDSLKLLLLPVVLLVSNLPVIYGLALYSAYEDIFVRMMIPEDEKRKMKWQVIKFAGINLSRITAIRKHLPKPIFCCKTSEDLQLNLDKLNSWLELQIGDNYMQRSKYYLTVCFLGLVLSLVGLISVNSDVSLEELVTFNFVFDILKIKEISTYIFSTMFGFSITLLLFAVGFDYKQGEDISKIKKYALYELLISVKKQRSRLADYPPVDEPEELFCSYLLNVYDIKVTCDRVLAAYENLLTSWEQETVKQLQFSASMLISDIGIGDENINKYTVAQFCDFYNEKVRTAPQSKEYNNYTGTLERSIKKYTECIEQFCVDFKYYY